MADQSLSLPEEADVELTILMPCLNEAETIETCVRQAAAFLEREAIVGEILVADNGSTDGSQQLATAVGARVIGVQRRGYGAALTSGIQAARGRFVAMGDADDSYDFGSLGPFIDRLRAGDELVMGNRFTGGIAPGAMRPSHRYLGNPVLSTIGRIFFRAPVRDFHCGLRAFDRESILSLGLRTSGMEFASEMVVKACLNELRVAEVPTPLRPDGRSRPSHLRSWRDGWRHLRFLMLYSPAWLVRYPGLAMLVLGAAAVCSLEFGDVWIGRVGFGVGSLLFASVALLSGLQAVLTSVLIREYAEAEGFLPATRNGGMRRHFSMESGLIAGILVFILGIALSIMALVMWGQHGFGSLDAAASMRAAVPGALGIAAGLQIVFCGLFLSTLRIRHK